MLRAIAVAGALLLGTMHSSAAAMDLMPTDNTCPATCRNMARAQPSVQDTISAGLARIAVRAAQPQSRPPALNRQERVELYLLLSLHRRAGGGRR